jgi:hypothetical protein
MFQQRKVIPAGLNLCKIVLTSCPKSGILFPWAGYYSAHADVAEIRLEGKQKMTMFAVFMVGTWVGLAFGLLLSGFGRMFRQTGEQQQPERSSSLPAHHGLVIAARGAQRS